MKMHSQLLLACLAVGCLAGTAQAFPIAGRHANQILYYTGRPVPAKYLAESNVIHNYRHYHLEKPLDGYVWLHGEDNDYLLVSLKSHIVKRIDTRSSLLKATDG